MRDLYEEEYGICNHRSISGIRPLSSVAMHPSEDFNTNSKLEEVLALYLQKNIREQYGLSITEFLDLPIDVIDMLIKVSDEHNARQPAPPKLPDIA